MNKQISRRDFLKLASAAPLAFSRPVFEMAAAGSGQVKPDNILIMVFDTFSANHLSFLGYPRETTPNLTRLLDRAIVFHDHYSAGVWTIPGTASLLTGTYPWTNRAFNLGANILEPYGVGKQNIFGEMEAYHRFAFTHNPLAQSLLKNMFNSIDAYTPRHELYLETDFMSLLFDNDYDTASLSGVQILKKQERGYANSLFLSELRAVITRKQWEIYNDQFPLGIPNIERDKHFLLEDAIDWLQKGLETYPQPFLGYVHVLPPHDPYLPRREFIDVFKEDGWIPKEKPGHLFKNGYNQEELNRQRILYDEFILYIDAEFQRLYEFMENMNLLENTWVIVTSDHGELFERRIWGHFEPVLFQGVTKVPLVIFPPGQTARRDIHTQTSAVDLLPTLAHLAGKAKPAWSEGRRLPIFPGEQAEGNRMLFAVESKDTPQQDKMLAGTAMILKDGMKLIKYFGHEILPEGEPMFEMFDLANDPEELRNLYEDQDRTSNLLRRELEAEIEKADKPYN